MYYSINQNVLSPLKRGNVLYSRRNDKTNQAQINNQKIIKNCVYKCIHTRTHSHAHLFIYYYYVPYLFIYLLRTPGSFIVY